MLSPHRQAVYWTLSLCAAGIFSFTQDYPVPRAVYHICTFATVAFLAQDALVEGSLTPDQRKWLRTLLYFSTTGTAAVLLGCVTPVLANGPVETRKQREILLHIRLAYVLIAQAEFWNSPVSPIRTHLIMCYLDR